nr:hypothetical protein BaRGS_004721 [Batillaria attramentaria]
MMMMILVVVVVVTVGKVRWWSHRRLCRGDLVSALAPGGTSPARPLPIETTATWGPPPKPWLTLTSVNWWRNTTGRLLLSWKIFSLGSSSDDDEDDEED